MNTSSQSHSKNTTTCLVVFLVLLELVGVYFFVEAYMDPRSKELKEISESVGTWNKTLPNFSNLSITVNENLLLESSSAEDWGSNIGEFPFYKHFYYNSDLALNSKLDYNQVSANYGSGEYDVVTNINFTVKSNNLTVQNQIKDFVVHSRRNAHLNSTMCNKIQKGYWDWMLGKCFYRYNTFKTCLVIDENLKLVQKFKDGCNKKGYFQQHEIVWTDKEFVKFNWGIEFEVRSQNDPYVYASRKGISKISRSAKQYFFIACFVCGVSSISLILVILFRKKNDFIPFQPENIN